MNKLICTIVLLFKKLVTALSIFIFISTITYERVLSVFNYNENMFYARIERNSVQVDEFEINEKQSLLLPV